jgi:microcystin-dependent protein
MGSPYVGEIRMFAGNFAPAGWAFCNGGLIAISQNEALFNLIGTTYGGDGQSTFALPNLQSRAPIHVGSSSGNAYVLGQSGGAEQITLSTAQIPSHTHAVNAVSSGASVPSPANALPGVSSSSGQPGTLQYGTGTEATNFIPSSVGATGGGQPHANIQPYLTISFIISLFGIFPSQN